MATTFHFTAYDHHGERLYPVAIPYRNHPTDCVIRWFTEPHHVVAENWYWLSTHGPWLKDANEDLQQIAQMNATLRKAFLRAETA